MKPPPLSEAQWLERVIALATMFKWAAYHVPFPVRPVGGGKFVPEARAAGLPDLILLHDDPPRVIFAELKASGKKPTVAQVEFLEAARRVSVESCRVVGSYLWRPEDEPTVESILRGRVLC